jgi:hypothetical protein
LKVVSDSKRNSELSVNAVRQFWKVDVNGLKDGFEFRVSSQEKELQKDGGFEKRNLRVGRKEKWN